MASLLKMIDPLFEGQLSRFHCTLDFKSRTRSARDEPEPTRQRARVIRIQWDCEDEGAGTQLQPGEVPNLSGAYKGHTYNWTW